MRHNIHRYIILPIFMLAMAVSAMAQASFRVISPGTVTQGQRFAITFVLENAQAANFTPPQINGCSYIGSEYRSSNSIIVNNGQMTQSPSTHYILHYYAQEAGTVNVPAVSIHAGGKTLSTKAFSFAIRPNGSAPVAPAPPSPSAPNSSPAPAPNPNPTTNSNTNDSNNSSGCFVNIELSRSKVYEQEPVICTIYLYLKSTNLLNFDIVQQPPFDGFLSQDLEVRPSFERVTYNGQSYIRAMVNHAILFPQKSGKLTIASGLYTAVIEREVDLGYGFHSIRPEKINIKSNSITLDVTPLPSGAPEGFNGAVGNYAVTSKISSNQLYANEAASITLTISGSGNIKYLKEPALNLPNGIVALSNKIDANVQTIDDNMRGTCTITYRIQPKDPGDYTIEPQKLVYFDPQTEQYVTVATEPIKVNVGPARASSYGSQHDIEEMADILYIAKENGAPAKAGQATFTSLWYWLLWLVALLVLLSIVVVYRKQVRLRADVTGQRMAHASKVATKRLSEARDAMNRNDIDAFYQALAKALWGYLADKFNIASSQLTRENIRTELESRNVNPDIITRLTNILDDCEMARFTPDSPELRPQAMYERASDIINDIEHQKLRTPAVQAHQVNPLDDDSEYLGN